MQSRFARPLAAQCVFLALACGNAHAQDSGSPALEEIVVTAAYREQGLQDVPVSITAVTGEAIIESAIQKAEDIQFLVPNFSLTETGIGTNAFVRGIGSGINQAFEQSVGTYVDGVYFGRAQQWRAPFLDLERVEVLRGPQSILFGKNSVAGAVNITTAKPTEEFEARLMGSWEFENSESIIEGMVSGPVSDRLRYRLAARSRNLDGYMENATLNRSEPQRKDWVVRGQLEFDITEDLVANLKVEAGEFDVTGRHIEIVNERPAVAGLRYSEILYGVFGADPSVLNVVQDEVRSSNGDFSYNDLQNAALTLDWALGDFALESITAYSNFEYDEFCDCDFTGAVVFGAYLLEKYDQFSQEVRLSSPLGGKFDYIGGLYYQTSDHEYSDNIIVPGDSILVPALGASGPAVADTQASRLASVDNDVVSAFAQLNWRINEATTLQVGGRITRDDRKGARTLSIVTTDSQPLPAGQVSAPFVYAGGFGITSTNLVDYSALPVPALAMPANAFLYYGWVNPDANGFTVPCTAASDPADCTGALGSLPVQGSRNTSKFSPEVKLIWNASEDALWYLSWSRGFKSGSYDFRANNKNFYPTMDDSFEFDDEEATNTEIGGKFTLADGAMEFNAAFFYTEYDDLQISIYDGILGFNVGNAASATTKGIETDMRWAVTDHLTFSGAAALTDFEFTDFENGQCYFGQAPNTDLDGNGVPELCSYTGNSNQLVSDFQGNLAMDIRVPVNNALEAHAVFNLFYTGAYDASQTFDPSLVQEGYTMLNARLGVGDMAGRWELAMLAKNLTDEKVLTYGGDTPLAGSTFGAKSNYAIFNPGRTLSLQARFNF